MCSGRQGAVSAVVASSRSLRRKRGDGVLGGQRGQHASGPTSRNRDTPASRSQDRPSANRTVSRTCSHPVLRVRSTRSGVAGPQWTRSGSAACRTSAPAPPRGSRRASAPSAREWNACDTVSRLVRRPSFSNFVASFNVGDAAPDSTTASRPVDRGDATPPASGARGPRPRTPAPRPSPRRPAAPASAGPARRPASPRPPGTAPRPTCAAAISPIECPATTSGRTPHDSTSRNSATSRANSAGCAWPVRSGRPRRVTAAPGSVREDLVVGGGEHRERLRTARGPCRAAASPGR